MNPPGMTFLVLITSRPVTLLASLPSTFTILVKTSASLPSSGETRLIVEISLSIRSEIFFAHLAIAATAWATTTGVPNPSENTVSNTHEISLPTKSAIRSRTVSRTNATTSPMIITTVLIAPDTVAAPLIASACSPEDCR
jgi:hypothetical protein